MPVNQESKFSEVGEKIVKTVQLKNVSTKSETRNGIPVGVIEGLAATWTLDRGDDIILEGAFAKTIARHSEEGRPVRMLFQHSSKDLIGGFPIDLVKETPEGLFVRGEINLEVQTGRESYALAKQGVLTDLSIGFSIPSSEAYEWKRDGDKVIRIIKEVDLWEISMVGEPMNPEACITAVKSVDLKTVEACNSLAEVESLLKGLGLSNECSKVLISRIKSAKAREELESNGKDDDREGLESVSKAAERLDKALSGIYQESINRTLNRL